MNWIDVNDRLPERGEDVLVVMQDVDGFTHTEIRWRSVYKDSVVDKTDLQPIHQRKKFLRGHRYQSTLKKTGNE